MMDLVQFTQVAWAQSVGVAHRHPRTQHVRFYAKAGMIAPRGMEHLQNTQNTRWILVSRPFAASEFHRLDAFYGVWIRYEFG